MGARGPAVAIAQRMVFVRDQVVVNQRSVQRTARRDHTPPLFVLADFLSLLGYDMRMLRVYAMRLHDSMLLPRR